MRKPVGCIDGGTRPVVEGWHVKKRPVFPRILPEGDPGLYDETGG